jgi:cellulose synthase/poly-beta-1,6-N-acetylglucosamine synthase-like glycosyltransferase
MKKDRLLEIFPGLASWGIIVFFVMLAIFKPVACAVAIIIFDFYWIIRTAYLTTLLVFAYRKLATQAKRDWYLSCAKLGKQSGLNRLYHLIIFPIYKEGPDVLRPSLEALKNSNYPKDKMIVVLAFEERNKDARDNSDKLQKEFKSGFLELLSTFHPEGLPGEKRLKGANATWAAKRAREFLNQSQISDENVIVSCFDADTCVNREYFGCLTYHFLTTPNPHQASYQPMPVYNNNIWHAPSLARLVEISASFCQLIESMRLEKFVTFSSHSMSFKTLVAIDYWPLDMISDDSVVYWKAFLYYKGKYRVVPLYVTVSMDIAYGKGFLKTLAVQYKQKRRWAWGVENFPFVVSRFIIDREMPFWLKARRTFHLLESHVSWAVWATIIIFMPPISMLLGGAAFSQLTAIGYNLPRVTGYLFNLTIITSVIWILLSWTILPPRPADVKWRKSLVMFLEWILVPFIILILGSTPALDAQTRLMLARYMEFNPTEKIKR